MTKSQKLFEASAVLTNAQRDIGRAIAVMPKDAFVTYAERILRCHVELSMLSDELKMAGRRTSKSPKRKRAS